MTALVYGVNPRWTPPPEVCDQLELADQLRADLVALQLQYDQDLKSIWSAFPAVAAAEASLDLAEQAASAAFKTVDAQRIHQHTERNSEASVRLLEVTRAQLKAARQRRRDAITSVRSAAAQQRRSRTKQLQTDRRGLYSKYCQPPEGPALYWATFNEVLRTHQDAVKRVDHLRASGRSATLRHRRWDGSGTIAVQLSRRGGQPARTPAVLADPTGKFRNVLFVPWLPDHIWHEFTRREQRAAGRFVVRMRCGTSDGSPTWVDVPVQAHRVLPATADIVGATLHIGRTPNGIRAKLSFRADVREVARPVSGFSIALHLGWRKMDSGTGVAVWRSTRALRVPPDLCSVVLAITPTSGRVVLPERITDAVLRADKTRSERAHLLNAIREEVCQYLDKQGQVPGPGLSDCVLGSDTVARWKSPAGFAALAVEWRAKPPPNGDSIAAALETWRRTDKELWIAGDYGQRRHALAARDDLYRRVAAVIASQADTLVVDDMNLSALARSAAVGTELASARRVAINHRRQVASPGRLRLAAIRGAARHGCRVIAVSARGLSSTHTECSFSNSPNSRDETGAIACEGCGAKYDPDENAVTLMLRRAPD